jgi:hypothetical protein
MIDLLALEPHKISTDMSSYTTLIYGPPKIGKTTFMYRLYGKDALFVETEKGYKLLAGAYPVDCGSWADFMRIVQQLRRKEVQKKFKVIVIDTIDLLYNYVEKYVLNKHGVDALNKIPYGQGWVEVSNTLFDALNTIEKLGYTLAFISHSTTKTEVIPQPDGKEQEFEKYVPTVAKRGLSIVSKMVDNILFATVRPNPETGQQERVIYTRETLQWQAGTRFRHMKPVLPLDAEAYKQAMLEAIEAEGQENLKDEHEDLYVKATEYDFDKLMQEARELAFKFHEAGRMDEVTAIVEKIFGPGAKLVEAKPHQVEQVAVAVEQMKAAFENK